MIRRWLAALALFALAGSARAHFEHKLVTGNGFGFAVYDAGALAKLYTHPYRFRSPGARPADDGVDTQSVVRRLRWETPRGVPRYLDQSHVIVVDGAAGQESYLMPFGLARCALVTTCATRGARLDVTWTSAARKRALGGGAWQVTAGGTDVLVMALGGDAPRMNGGALTGAPGWALVALEPGDAPAEAAAAVRRWVAGSAPAALAAREAGELDRWRVAPPAGLSPMERRLWRQSEAVLRMAQVREPDAPGRHASGLILASLPDGEFFIPWVRDMAYALVALARMGHADEARRGLTAWMNARPVGKLRASVRGQDYQISLVRYFGDGSEADDYSGEPRPNLELDDWGLALWAMGEYVARTHDTGWLTAATYRGAAYAAARDFVFRPLVACLDPAGAGSIVTRDSCLWEQNDEPYKHYACATAAAFAGARAFGALARAAGDADLARRCDALQGELTRGFRASFTKDGKLVGSDDGAPRNAMDGALLNAIDFGVVTDPALVRSTLARMEALRTPSGGYKRVNGTTDYEAQEFVFIDVNYARMLLRTGDRAAADAIVARLVDRAAADHDLIPELYLTRPSEAEGYDGPVDAPAGSIPMVGYGPGILMMYWMERAAGR